jgi:hypothetical protein
MGNLLLDERKRLSSGYSGPRELSTTQKSAMNSAAGKKLKGGL